MSETGQAPPPGARLSFSRKLERATAASIDMAGRKTEWDSGRPAARDNPFARLLGRDVGASVAYDLDRMTDEQLTTARAHI